MIGFFANVEHCNQRLSEIGGQVAENWAALSNNNFVPPRGSQNGCPLLLLLREKTNDERALCTLYFFLSSSLSLSLEFSTRYEAKHPRKIIIMLKKKKKNTENSKAPTDSVCVLRILSGLYSPCRKFWIHPSFFFSFLSFSGILETLEILAGGIGVSRKAK